MKIVQLCLLMLLCSCGSDTESTTHTTNTAANKEQVKPCEIIDKEIVGKYLEFGKGKVQRVHGNADDLDKSSCVVRWIENRNIYNQIVGTYVHNYPGHMVEFRVFHNRGQGETWAKTELESLFQNGIGILGDPTNIKALVRSQNNTLGDVGWVGDASLLYWTDQHNVYELGVFTLLPEEKRFEIAVKMATEFHAKL